MRGTSFLATSVMPVIRRTWRCDLTSMWWALPPLGCMILPEPVTLNRFLAPLWVFCFGMTPSLLHMGRIRKGTTLADPLSSAPTRRRPPPNRSRSRLSAPMFGGGSGLLFRSRRGLFDLGLRCLYHRLPGLGLGVSAGVGVGRVVRGCRCRAGLAVGGGLALLLGRVLDGAGLGHGLGLLLVRAEHHDHVAAVLLRGEFHEAELGHVLGQTAEQPAAELRARLLAAA